MNDREFPVNLTQYERVALDQMYNLADGHARHSWSDSQKAIIDRFPDIFRDSATVRQREREEAFIHSYYGLAGQPQIGGTQRLLCHSASASIDIVAAHLAASRRRVALLEPCFDNLATILAHRGVRMTPLPEEALIREDITGALNGADVDALFITVPNNPTGLSPGRAGFAAACDWCAANDKLLVVDFSFRFHDDDLSGWNQYDMLSKSGISYICIEDSGKTWATLDLKCSILAASPNLIRELTLLHNDMLLNVSPFILALLTDFIDDSARYGLPQSVRAPISINRSELRAAISGSRIVPRRPDSTISVEWLGIDDPSTCDLDVVNIFADMGIGVLPGHLFYWHRPEAGSKFFRVALSRPTEMFRQACDLVREVTARHFAYDPAVST